MKRVLIVDDSKTAQIRLKKMLSSYPLAVDMAYSAEEALGYLSYESPSVIFMDHHMEGMDGLEALKIIKANPNTAMIPVIMYTAQQGDVYVGQARALGALDILSKEVMKPSSLERVLSSLGIEAVDEHESESLGDDHPAHNKSEESPTFDQIRSQVARMFELHSADIRQQITDNSRSIVHKVTEEIEKTLNKEPTVGDIPLSVVNAEMSADQRRYSFVSGSVLILIFLGLALLTFELFQTRQEIKSLVSKYNDLIEVNQVDQNNNTVLSETKPQTSNQEETQINSNALIDALSWALETNLQFEFNAPPLADSRVVEISNLVYRLASAGFRGTVELNIHFGNVCLQHNDVGTWRLADESLPLEDCTMLEELSPEFSASDYLSISYLNFEQTAAPLKNGLIELQVISGGLNSPRFQYPVMRPGISAGTWNNIALKNNRIAVSLNYL